MCVVALHHGDPLLVAAAAIDGGDFTNRLPGALDRKEVQHGSRDEHRPWIREQQQPGVIHAGRDEIREVLLRVAVGILEDPVVDAHGQGRDVAGRRHDADARVERPDQRCLEPASARARDAHARRIHLRARQQVVERAHAVPHLPSREVGSGQVGEVAENGVFAADQVVAAAARRSVPELAALTLTHRVPADHDVAPPHEALAERLVVGLAVRRVAAGDEHRRTRGGSAFGHVQQRRHEHAWQAFEDELLDPEAVHLHHARDPCVQRRPFRRQSADHPEQRAAKIGLQPLHVLPGTQRGEARSPLVVLSPGQLRLVREKRRDARTVTLDWQHGEGLGRRHTGPGEAAERGG